MHHQLRSATRGLPCHFAISQTFLSVRILFFFCFAYCGGGNTILALWLRGMDVCKTRKPKICCVSKKLTISLMNERREGGEYIMLVFFVCYMHHVNILRDFSSPKKFPQIVFFQNASFWNWFTRLFQLKEFLFPELFVLEFWCYIQVFFVDWYPEPEKRTLWNLDRFAHFFLNLRH